MTAVHKLLLSGKKRELDMTQGSIIGNLMKFALPLLVGNLFQQLYNMVDTWVIGQTGENGAYAAVGSVGPIINILIGFFSGLATGAGVIISQHFGAKDRDGVRRAVHTSMAMTLVMGVLFTIIGVTMAPLMLKLMLRDTSSEIFPFAKQYLTIYFSGVMGLMLYNMGAGILRAVGDSQRPLFFLIVSAVTNTLLDLLFVLAFDWGAAGVAWATIIAQWLSALLTLFVLIRSDSWVQLKPRELRCDREMLKRIIAIGIPSALQMALTAFANVFVQSYIGSVNGDQAVNLGGWTTYSKVDAFIFLPVQSLAMATTAFVGQNLGIGDVKRAKTGTLIAWAMSTLTSLLIIITVMIFARPLASLFNPNDGVVDAAVRLLHLLTPFYICCSVNQILSASLRGAGNTRAPMIIMLSTFIGVRQIYLYVMSTFISNELLPVGFGYPVGWMTCAAAMLIYYLRFDFSKVKVAARNIRINESGADRSEDSQLSDK